MQFLNRTYKTLLTDPPQRLAEVQSIVRRETTTRHSFVSLAAMQANGRTEKRLESRKATVCGSFLRRKGCKLSPVEKHKATSNCVLLTCVDSSPTQLSFRPWRAASAVVCIAMISFVLLLQAALYSTKLL